MINDYYENLKMNCKLFAQTDSDIYAMVEQFFRREFTYFTGVPEKVDELLSLGDIPNLENAPMEELRLRLITPFLSSEEKVPLGILTCLDSMTIWDTETSFRERFETKHRADPRVTMAEKEVRWYAARKNNTTGWHITPTSELVHDYCIDHKLPLELEKVVYELIFNSN